MLNNVILIGNIGIVKRGFIEGSMSNPYTMITLATDSYYIKDGEKRHSTLWHNVRFRGDIARNFDRLGLDKGDRIFVEGSINYFKKDDRTYTNIEAFRFLIINRANNNTDEQQQEQMFSPKDEDIPF